MGFGHGRKGQAAGATAPSPYSESRCRHSATAIYNSDVSRGELITMSRYWVKWRGECPKCNKKTDWTEHECDNCRKGHIRSYRVDSCIFYGCDFCEQSLGVGIHCKGCGASITDKFIRRSGRNIPALLLILFLVFCVAVMIYAIRG